MRKMKSLKNLLHLTWFLALLGGNPFDGFAQIGVGTTTPHPSAMLHISPGAGNNKGLVMPSITSASRVVLDSTQNIKHGLVFFDTDLQKFYYFHQSPRQWFELDHDWIRKDVAGASPVVGTHIYSGVPGNVGIGTASNINPGSKLTVVGNMAVGSATYTQDSVASVANGATFGTWVGIGTATKSSGVELDVKGDVKITNTLVVGGTVTASRYFGEGIAPPGLVSMWSGTLNTSTNFDATGLGVPGTAYAGWAICNGKNGTPDLRGRFIVGLTNTDGTNYGYTNSERNFVQYNLIGKHGGLDSVAISINQMPVHNHTSSMSSAGSHTHTVTGPSGCTNGVFSSSSGCYMSDTPTSVTTNSAGSHTHSLSINDTGNDEAHENRPPYYVLAYIMKLP
jgi:microcystin-dependent protein